MNQRIEPHEEADLMRRVAAKDAAAIEQFHACYQGWIFKAVQLSRVPPEHFDDVLQHTYITLLSVADQYDAEKGRLTTWIGYRVRGVVSDWRRRRKRLQRQHEMPDFWDAPQPVATSETDTEELHAFIASLDERDRTVAEMVMLGATLEETGEKIGVTRERVRQLRLRLGDKFITYKLERAAVTDQAARQFAARKATGPEPERLTIDCTFDEAVDRMFRAGPYPSKQPEIAAPAEEPSPPSRRSEAARARWERQRQEAREKAAASTDDSPQVATTTAPAPIASAPMSSPDWQEGLRMKAADIEQKIVTLTKQLDAIRTVLELTA